MFSKRFIATVDKFIAEPLSSDAWDEMHIAWCLYLDQHASVQEIGQVYKTLLERSLKVEPPKDSQGCSDARPLSVSSL